MVGVLWCMNRKQKDLRASRAFWYDELMTLLSLGGFFGFIYLLSGLWILKLVLLLLIAVHLGSVVGWMLNLILGEQSEKSDARIFWAGGELTLRYTVPMSLLWIISALVVWSYPVISGIHFFRHQWGSGVIQAEVVKWSLLLLSLSGYVVVAVVNALILASEDLDDDTRQRMFINQAVGLIPLAIYVALAFWAFGLNGAPLTLGLFWIPTGALSLQTLGLLLALFALTVLIPFLMGTQRTRRKRRALLKRVKDLLGELEDILETPTDRNGYVGKLNALHSKVTGIQEEFTNADAFLSKERKGRLEPEKIDQALKPFEVAIEKSRDLDPRFDFVDRLGKLLTQIVEVKTELEKRSEASVEAAATQFGEKYKARKEELGEEIEGFFSHRPMITAGAGSVVSVLILTILGEVGKTAWAWIEHAQK